MVVFWLSLISMPAALCWWAKNNNNDKHTVIHYTKTSEMINTKTFSYSILTTITQISMLFFVVLTQADVIKRFVNVIV